MALKNIERRYLNNLFERLHICTFFLKLKLFQLKKKINSIEELLTIKSFNYKNSKHG